ncbi:MAG: hypothetical protein GX444_05690 [Myxococcales bacterium]|nr:hypothetical protein [Myxococcales bacterium]
MKLSCWFFGLLVLLLALAACSSDGGDDLESASDDDNDDAGLDDDDGGGDDDDNDDNDDDTPAPGDSSPSFNYGIVHYHYYGDLGGYDGQIFLDDQKWAAANVELGIIGNTDDGSRMAWSEIRANQPRGWWLVWQTAHLFNTREAEGDCANPQPGDADQAFAERQAEFAAFLDDYPAYGDGENCFLHARRDGRIQARWHALGCDIILNQAGEEGSAPDRKGARIETMVWDEYAWLFDLGSDCARDFHIWKVGRQITDDGFSGGGFDNLGSPLADGYYLPVQIDDIDIEEIPDDVEADAEKLDDWYYDTVTDFLTAVGAGLREIHADAVLVFNGATYCSWDGYTEQLAAMVSAGVGIWCESGLQYPSWGAIDTPDRIEALADLSGRLAEKDSFLVLETAYDGGQSDPSPEEVLYYLAALYALKSDGDFLSLVPDWSPYSPLKDVLWFPVFERDLGQPTGPAEAFGDGIFTRPYRRSDGLETLVLVRVDGDNAAVSYSLDGDYCRVGADDALTPLTGDITVESGDGLILLVNGTGDAGC